MNILLQSDKQILEIVDKHGGWPRVLDPAFEPPEEIYACVEAAGYSRKNFDALRIAHGQPERVAWVEKIARSFYNWWRFSFLLPERPPLVRWQDLPSPDCWEMFVEPMTRLEISRDEVDNEINSKPAEYPPFSGNNT
jgi:hypothetical protein